MVTQNKKSLPLSTIWEVNDELWNIIQAILDEQYPPAKFGDDRSVHRTLQRWVAKGIFTRVWALLVENCAELGGADWNGQNAEGALNKARFGGIRSAPTLRIAVNQARNAA